MTFNIQPSTSTSSVVKRSYKSTCSRTGQSGELLRIVLITEQTRNKDNYTQAWLLFAVFLDRAITTVLNNISV